MKPQRFDYEQTCSRCDGSTIDCCTDGVETLHLTEEEALGYPNAKRATTNKNAADRTVVPK